MNFYEKAQDRSNAMPINEEQAEMFVLSTLIENSSSDRLITGDCILSKHGTGGIMFKRLQFSKNENVKFMESGIIACMSLANSNPGRAVTLVIDLLTAFSETGKLVTASVVAEMFPFGHYSEEVFRDYIDNYLKPRIVKFSELY